MLDLIKSEGIIYYQSRINPIHNREATGSVFNEDGVYYADAIISFDFEYANPDGESMYHRILDKSSQEVCARPAMWIKAD